MTSSIRVNLLKRLMLPLVGINLVGAALTYWLAWAPAQAAFDQSLANSAWALTPRLQEGWKITRAEYDATREVIRGVGRTLAETLREVDFLLTPSAPSEAPASLASTGDPVFNRAWTMLGLPCVTIPHGKGAHGLPLAVQLFGALDADSALLAWAGWSARTLAA